MYSLRSRTEEEDAFVLILALVSDHIEGHGVLDYRDSEGVKERLVQGVEDGILGVDSGDDLYGEDLVLVLPDSLRGLFNVFCFPDTNQNENRKSSVYSSAQQVGTLIRFFDPPIRREGSRWGSQDRDI